MTATPMAWRASQIHPRRRAPAVISGLVLLALSTLAVAYPGPTLIGFGAASGWLLWFAGAVMFGFAFFMFSGQLRILGCAAALAAVGAGAWLTFHPHTGALATVILVVSAIITDGAAQLAAALHLRPLAAWRWLFASALASLVAAALLISGAPAQATEIGAWVLALAFGTSGAALLGLGVTPRGQ